MHRSADINRGLRVWQEPHGGWAATFYCTPECKKMDYYAMHDEQGDSVQEWLALHSPSEHDGLFCPDTAQISWNEVGGDTALLFKMAFVII